MDIFCSIVFQSRWRPCEYITNNVQIIHFIICSLVYLNIKISEILYNTYAILKNGKNK